MWVIDMELIVTNASRKTLGYLPDSAIIDLDVGVDDDYSITIPLVDYDKDLIVTGGYWFAPGTEYGGMLCNPLIDTAAQTVTFSGDTWRGMLKKKITDPGTENYLSVSGTSAQVLTALVGQNNQFGSLFTFGGSSTITSATTRWEPVLDAIENICAYQDKRLVCTPNESSSGTLTVQLKLEDVVDSDVEYSQDQGFEFKIQNVTDRYNYLIALGSGQLKDRMVNKFSVNSKNKLTAVSSIPAGVNNRVFVFDYPNAESAGILQKSARKKIAEVNRKASYSMTIPEDFVFEIGENIKGRDYVTGTTINAYVARKIVKVESGHLSVSYELK